MKKLNQPHGMCDSGYHLRRKSNLQHSYRLKRRTHEVEQALKRHCDHRLAVLVDVGTADGLMLQMLESHLGSLLYIGLDLSFELLSACRGDRVHKCQCEAACLPLKRETADVVIATAVIEHVADASRMVSECGRILRPGGVLVLSTPDPFMEHLASALGLLKESGHVRTFTLRELASLVRRCGFHVLESRKFMLSPVGLPFELAIERFICRLGFDRVLANQLLVARRI